MYGNWFKASELVMKPLIILALLMGTEEMQVDLNQNQAHVFIVQLPCLGYCSAATATLDHFFALVEKCSLLSLASKSNAGDLPTLLLAM